MIVTKLHKGQGFGNQLWVYVVTRAIAKKNGFDFGIKDRELWKGAPFMPVDFGKDPEGIVNLYQEKQVLHPQTGADITGYDQNLILILDNTEIKGNFQDEKYIEEFKSDVKNWLRLDEKYECRDYSSEDICIVNFRGGEYTRHTDLFLSEKYWQNAVKNMQKINPNFKFVVVTDDAKTAKKFFPDFEVLNFGLDKDYSIIKNAHYLIMSNTSFAWFPAWTSETLKYCIAPKYWARHNVSDGYWSMESNLTRGWFYQDRNGILHDYDSCLSQLERYKAREVFDITRTYFPTIGTSKFMMKLRDLLPKNLRKFFRKIK